MNVTQQLSPPLLPFPLPTASSPEELVVVRELEASFSRRRRPMDSSSHSILCLRLAMVANASLLEGPSASVGAVVEGATPQSSA